MYFPVFSGQVDYYPNSGSQQPNCLLQTCSHSRAWVYFTESVLRPDAFPAVKCRDWEAFKKKQCEDLTRYRLGFSMFQIKILEIFKHRIAKLLVTKKRFINIERK